jgi:CRISPR-associated protein Csm4
MADLLENPRPPWVEEADLLQGGVLWVHPFDRQELAGQFGDLHRFRLWAEGQAGVRPRVTVDRQQSLSTLYHMGQVYFRQGCGFYLLVDDKGPDGAAHRCYLESALHTLGELGLGGRRSVGLGQFDIGPAQEVSPPAASVPEAHLLMSLYHPARDEVGGGILKGARYELIVRRGWIFSPDDASQRRRSVRMLAEGALLPWAPTGDMLNAAPLGFPHPVYRSGIALTLPVRRWHDE